MSKSLLYLFTALLIASCASEPELKFELKSLTVKDLSACQNKDCPEVLVDYQVLDSGHPMAAVINQENEKYLATIINGAVLPDSLETSLEKAINAFVISFQDYTGDFPDAVETYELDVQNFVSFKDHRFISLETDFYIYTGGAHGYGGQEFLNLDAQTGKVLTIDKLINNLEDFTQFAEASFKRQHGIAANEAINSTGFWFDNDTFYLSETYGFTEQGFEIIYQPYDIASYAQGPISLQLSWDEINQFL